MGISWHCCGYLWGEVILLGGVSRDPSTQQNVRWGCYRGTLATPNASSPCRPLVLGWGWRGQLQLLLLCISPEPTETSDSL